MKGQHRAMLYALCLVVLIITEAATSEDLGSTCNCRDGTITSETTTTTTTKITSTENTTTPNPSIETTILNTTPEPTTPNPTRETTTPNHKTEPTTTNPTAETTTPYTSTETTTPNPTTETTTPNPTTETTTPNPTTETTTPSPTTEPTTPNPTTEPTTTNPTPETTTPNPTTEATTPNSTTEPTTPNHITETTTPNPTTEATTPNPTTEPTTPNPTTVTTTPNLTTETTTPNPTPEPTTPNPITEPTTPNPTTETTTTKHTKTVPSSGVLPTNNTNGPARKRHIPIHNKFIPNSSVITAVPHTTPKINCSEVCRAQTTPYVSVELAPKPKPTQYPSHEPNWGPTELSIPLTIYVHGIFSAELHVRNSSTYSNYFAGFNESLTNLYKNITGFAGVEILGFFNGSIGCRFVVLVAPSNSNPINTTQLRNSIKAARYTNAHFNVKGKDILGIETKKTNNAIQKALEQNHFEKVLQKTCIDSNVCLYDTVCVVNKQRFICTHKCNANNICSKNGECYVDKDGDVECRCKKDSTYVYSGHTCKDKVLVFFSGKNTAIIGACAGAVIAFLLLLVIYLGARWRRKRTSKLPDEKLSDPEEIRKDNFQIENVPMDGVGKTNPMYRPDKSDHHHEEGHGDYYSGERSSRESVYEDELAYNEGRYYRVLKDPDNRTKAYVYQPSNMSIPNQRSSTASKFDDLDSKPLSSHLRPEKEQQSFHDMVDTDQPYSIRRPQIMRSTVNSDGYR